ncbi:BQ2448_2548 [Microbotryum intermedium]|uniref:BQ2448_2548 protein n=1 Tax=Microbotryum intermedium TaxID=269621 RepID=A0A238FEG7_9BASI|nr:BQ2448_2548 [Microbotryum intermedium]
MARPLSPSSMPSYGATPRAATPALSDDVEPCSSASATRSTRVCRSLVVQAAAHDEGVGATLYCRIAVPASMSTAMGSPSDYTSTQRTLPFLTLPVTAQLKHYSSYPLPLETSLRASVTEAAQAAHILGITADDSPHPGRTTPSGRRSSLAASRPPRPHNREIRLFRTSQDANEISLVVEREVASSVSSMRPTSPMPLVDPSDEAGDRNEWILVMRIESHFGDLKLPRFANKVVIPVPPCLRNLLTFELPSPAPSTSSSAEGQWGFSMKPDLRNLSSKLSSVSSSATTLFTGSFKSTSSIALSWIRLDTPPADFVITHSHLDVRWSIGSTGSGRAMLACTGDFEYAGLKDKRWIEIVVSHALLANAEQKDVVQVSGVRGEGVLKWELAGSSSTTTRSRSQRQPRKTAPGMHSTAHATPTTHTRPRTLGIADSRPLSYTSLFDTTAPEAPEIDPGLAARIDPERVQAKLKEPSLLRQMAPFPSQVDDSIDDTFEAASENDSIVSEEPPIAIMTTVTPQKAALIDSWLTSSSESEPEPNQEIREADSDSDDDSGTLQLTILRVQLDLSILLMPQAMPNPTFALELDFDFASGALRPSTMVAESGTASSTSPLRLVLPHFSVVAAAQEDAVVSVSAGDGRSVEMLASNSMMNGDFERSQFDSPLPAAGGKARWRTERNGSDEDTLEHHELVEVEISTRTTTQPSPAKIGIDLDDMSSSGGSAAEDEASPSLARARRGPARKRALPPLLSRTTSTHSLRSQPSHPSLTLGHRMSSSSLVGLASSNLGLVKLRITPVPPLAPYQPWRLFSHLTLARPVGSLELPLRGGSNQKVEVCDTWDARGVSTEIETEMKEGKVIVEGEASSNRMTVRESPKETRERQSGMKEMLYKVETMQEGDSVEIGNVLPAFDVKVASMEVEVVPVAGYDLKMDGQTFDSATPVVEGKPTTFSKFQIAPRDMFKLSIHLEAKVATPPASPKMSVGFAPSPTILPSPSPLAIQAVGSPASALGTPPLSPIPAFELDAERVPQKTLQPASRPWTWPLLAVLASIWLGFITRPESFASMFELAFPPRFSAPPPFPVVPLLLSSSAVPTEAMPTLTLDTAPVAPSMTVPTVPAPTPAPTVTEDLRSATRPTLPSDETPIPQLSSNIDLSPSPNFGTALVNFVHRVQSEVKARIEDLFWVVMSLIGLP